MKMTFPTAPNEFSLNITNMCNLDCMHCNVAATKNAAGDLTTAEWKKLIAELAEMKVFKIIMSGGEPFMRPDIFELIEHIFTYHFRLHINTNGTLIDKKTTQFLKRFKRLECVQVSIEGSTAGIHEKIRPKGSFERAVQGITLLRAAELPVVIYTVLNKYNCSDIEDIALLAKRLGVGSLTITDLLPVGNAATHLRDLSLSTGERRALSNGFNALIKKYRGFISGPLVKTEEFFGTFASRARSLKHDDRRYMTSCGGCFNTCDIRPDGWVIPCSRMWEYKIDSVRKKSFKTIWLHSEKMRKFRERRLTALNDIPECAGCEYISLCCGGCPAVPFQYGKKITGWDPTSCYKVFTGKKESYLNIPGTPPHRS